MPHPSFAPLDRQPSRHWYRPYHWANWEPCSYVGVHSSGKIICSEVGRVLAGRFLVSPSNFCELGKDGSADVGGHKRP